jgi:hypothetical protein
MFSKNTDFPITNDYKLSDLNNEPKKYLKSNTLKSPIKGKAYKEDQTYQTLESQIFEGGNRETVPDGVQSSNRDGILSTNRQRR